MKRRAFLSTVPAALAVLGGCGGSGVSSDRPSPTRRSSASATTGTLDATTGPGTPTDHPERTTTEPPGGETPTETYSAPPRDRRVDVAADGPRTASLVDLETVARTCAFDPRTKADAGRVLTRRFRAAATGDHPAIVAGELHNGTDEAWIVPTGETFPFGPLASAPPRPPVDPCGDPSGPRANALVLAPTANHDLVEDPPAVYRARDGRWRVDATTLPAMPREVTLAPGESLFAEAALVGPKAGTGTGLRPGWYRFGPRPGTTVAVWPTARPGPAGSSRFAGRSVPPLTGSGSTVWFHEAGHSTGTYLVPGTERTGLPATVRWSLVNHSRRRYRRGPPDLYKLHDDRWFELGSPSARPATPRPLPELLPGGSVCWRIGLRHGEADPGEGSVDDVATYLGGGTYALAVPHPAEAGDDIEALRRSAALVAVDAPGVAVEPRGDLDATRRDATVEVTDPERDPPASLAVQRTDGDGRPVIAEQVMTLYPGLRDTLPFFEPSVERVVLRTAGPVVDRTLGALVPDRTDATRVTVRFRGETYEVRETTA